MLGKATLTIVASRNASSAPNDATSSAPVLLTRRSPRSVACGCDALAVDIDRTQPGERRAEARKGLFDRGLSRSDEAAPFSEVTQLAGGKRAELGCDENRRHGALDGDPRLEQLDRAHDRRDGRGDRTVGLLRHLVRLNPSGMHELTAVADIAPRLAATSAGTGFTTP